MKQEHIVLSASSIGDLECPHKFHKHRVLKIWPSLRSQSAAAMRGIAIHRVLENLYDPTTGPPPHLEMFDRYLRFAFLSLPFPDQQARLHEQELARPILCAYVSQNDDDEHVLAVEKQATFPVRFDGVEFSISARLDKISRLPGSSTLTVTDYKTGMVALSMFQAWINLVAAKKMFPGHEAYELRVDTLTDSILEENRVERVVYSSKDFKGVFADVAAKVKRFQEDTERPAVPGSKCAYCPERPVCTGQEAVDGEQLDF